MRSQQPRAVRDTEQAKFVELGCCSLTRAAQAGNSLKGPELFSNTLTCPRKSKLVADLLELGMIE